MTISSETSRIAYAGDGSTTEFPFPYPLLAAADLLIVETVTATGVQSTKALTTHYSVSIAADKSSATVTAVTAPASGVTWSLIRDPARVQTTDFVDNSSLAAASIENALDRAMMVAQRNNDLITRSLRQPDGDTATIGALPSKVERAGKFAAFDGDGNPIASSGTVGDSEIAVSSFAETLLDDADAATARSTLGLVPGTDVLAPDGDGSALTGIASVPTGFMGDYAGAGAVPSGWLLCDGSNVSRSTYAALFAAIGETWGAGDGSETFGLPDTRRRVSVGSGGTGTGTLANSVGSTGGEEDHTQTTAEMPAHTHLVGSDANQATVGSGIRTAGNDSQASSSTGSGDPFNVMQPSYVVQKIIKT